MSDGDWRRLNVWVQKRGEGEGEGEGEGGRVPYSGLMRPFCGYSQWERGGGEGE